MPATIGRGGMSADKREGDGATPVGAHRIVGMYYRADRIGAVPRGAKLIGAKLIGAKLIGASAIGAKMIGPGDLWSDDPADAAYNHPVRTPHPFGHEKLRRADPQYDLVLVTDWNFPDAQPGRGSAIFVHQWRRPHAPTAGCIGLRRRDLRWIAGRVGKHTRVIVRG